MTLADRLRAALSMAPEPPLGLLTGDIDLTDAAGVAATDAAVLIAVTDRPEPGVILTERSPALRRHAGQIAFPGGRVDPGDADAAAAAVREADEELGIDPGRVTVIGELDRYRTITGFDVTPVVAVIPPDLPMRPNPDEVADWFEMPLRILLDPAVHVAARLDWQGTERHFYEIGWNGRRIWGATAAIAINLSRRMTPAW